MSETGGIPDIDVTIIGDREVQKQQIPYGVYDASLLEQSEPMFPDEDESGQSDDDSPNEEIYDDEDFEESIWDNDLERRFEENSYNITKKATLSVLRINGGAELTVLVQNLGQPLDPKQSLDGKAELLKKIGQIICNDDFLIKIALSGRELPVEGYLPYPQIYNRAGKKATNTNASKIISEEFIEILDNTYSLRQFFQDQGGKERVALEEEMMIYWSNHLDVKNFNQLSGMYKIEKRRMGKQTTYYKNFKRFKKYIVTTIVESPVSWNVDEIAEFYIKRRNLNFNEALRHAVLGIIERLRSLLK